MRVVFVNRYFHPDHSATSQLLTDLATHLASIGWDVAVVTSRQLYDDPAARLSSRDSVAGVAVRRIWTTRFGRTFLLLRAVDYLTFLLSALIALRGERRSIVVPLTDPPLLSVVAALAPGRTVNWIQDLFPEVARALGFRIPRLVDRLRDWSFRRAAMNVAIGEQMARRVAGPAVVQHNWASVEIHPIDRAGDSTFTVAYSGNLGRAHEFETMLGAMRALPGVRFVVSGGGALHGALKKLAPANVEFRDYAPLSRLAASLSVADVHLVVLRPELEGLIVPSKFYGILAAGRPVIHIGDAGGEIGRLIVERECGFVVPAGDAQRLRESIETLERDRELRLAMGRRARALYDERFAPPIAFANWTRILESIGDG